MAGWRWIGVAGKGTNKREGITLRVREGGILWDVEGELKG